MGKRGRQRKYSDEERKERIAETNRRWYRKKSKEHLTDYWCIYYLPEEHYCGITRNMFNRMKSHAKKFNIEGYRVLATANTYEEAIAIETEFHLMGMNGHQALKHIKQINSKNK